MYNVLYDVTGCTRPDPEPAELTAAMRDAANRLGCTVRAALPVAFQPHGSTCVLVLAESHLTVSTWPESGLAHVDLFTCRADVPPDTAIIPILEVLGSRTFTRQEIVRSTAVAAPAAAHGAWTARVARTSPGPSPCRVPTPG